MIFTDFLTKYNGQQNVGNTTENKGECVGLVCVWIEELGLPHVWGHAMDLFTNADENFFEKILNTPDAIPKAGDIIVWKKAFNGTFGHTGIATGTGDLNTFECFEQNDPLGSNCHLKSYNYNNVTGWLRPKVAQNQQALIEELRADRDKNWQLYQQQLQHSIDQETVIEQKQKTIDAITKENLTLKDQYKAATDQHTSDLGAIQGLTADNKALNDTITMLHTENAKITVDLHACQIQQMNLSYATTKQLIKELFKRFHL